MAEPEDTPKTPPSTPPPLPPKQLGKDAPPPLHKPTARVPAVGASQSKEPFRDPFAIEEEADTSSVEEALKHLPPPLPADQLPPEPDPVQSPRDLPVQSGKTMRITLPGAESEPEESRERTSNPGKAPVAPQPAMQPPRPKEVKPNEPALLPGAYTKQLGPQQPTSSQQIDRPSKEEAKKQAEQELSKIEGWLSGGAPDPKAPASSTPAPTETPPALPPQGKKPEPMSPPPLPAADSKPPSLPAKPEAKEAPKPEPETVAKPPSLPVKPEAKDAPKPAPSSPPPLPPAASTPPSLPAKPEAKDEPKPSPASPPALPTTESKPPSLPPKAEVKEEPKPESKPPTLPRREGPPRLSTVKPVGEQSPAPKERPTVEMPKMQMLDKKPQKLLSRQRRDKQLQEEARQREERNRERFAPRPIPTKSPEPKKEAEAKKEPEPEKEAAAPSAPPPLPAKPEAAKEAPDAGKQVPPSLPTSRQPEEKPAPAESTKSEDLAKPEKDESATKQPPVLPVKTSQPDTKTPESKASSLPEGEKIAKPEKTVEKSLPGGAALTKKEPVKGDIPGAKPVKAEDSKVALPAVVPVSMKPDAKSGVPVKPSKTADAPEGVAKPMKADAAGPAKPVKAGEEEARPVEKDPVDEPKAEEKPEEAVASKPVAAGQGGFKDLSFPTVDHTNKKPAPLLSRQRRDRQAAMAKSAEPAGVGAGAAAMPGASPLGSGKGTRERASKSPAPRQLAGGGSEPPGKKTPPPASEPLTPGQRIAYRIGAYAALIVAVLAVGYLTYYFMRETRVVGEVLIKPSSGFKVEEVAAVIDFRGDLAALAQDLAEERQPLQRDIRELERNLSLANEDMVGREARLQYLREDIQKAQAEIEVVLKGAQTQAAEIWEGPGKELDVQYETKLEETRMRIRRRAEQLGLDYNPSDEFDSPEVWVNAFRLALYDAPTGVNAGQERLWAESVLREWKEYNETWRGELQGLKDQVKQIQMKPRQQIEDIRRNIADLKARIATTEEEIQPLRNEIRFNESRLQEKRQLEASLEEPKYKQVIQASRSPQMIIKALTLDPETNRFYWNNIQADPRFKPGEYLLWVRASREGEEYWAFAKFTIQPDTTTQLMVYQTRLQSVREALRRSTPLIRND